MANKTLKTNYSMTKHRKNQTFFEPIQFRLRLEKSTMDAVKNNCDNVTAYINSAVIEKLKRDNDNSNQSKSF